MFREPSELDKAELRQEFRRLYRERGPVVCFQVLYELLKSGEVLTEIMLEEQDAANRDMNHG